MSTSRFLHSALFLGALRVVVVLGYQDDSEISMESGLITKVWPSQVGSLGGAYLHLRFPDLPFDRSVLSIFVGESECKTDEHNFNHGKIVACSLPKRTKGLKNKSKLKVRLFDKVQKRWLHDTGHEIEFEALSRGIKGRALSSPVGHFVGGDILHVELSGNEKLHFSQIVSSFTSLTSSTKRIKTRPDQYHARFRANHIARGVHSLQIRISKALVAGYHDFDVTIHPRRRMTEDFAHGNVHFTESTHRQILVFPSITNIEHMKQSEQVTKLSVYGTGFSPAAQENVVTVRGNHCKIVRSDFHVIDCIFSEQREAIAWNKSGKKKEDIGMPLFVSGDHDQRFLISDEIKWPPMHPLHPHGLQVRDMDLQTPQNGLAFVAPMDGTYHFELSCDGSTFSETGSGKNCQLEMEQQGIFLKRGEKLGCRISFHHHALDQKQMVLATIIAGKHRYEPTPAQWFVHEQHDDDDHHVQVTTNGFLAKCRMHPNCDLNKKNEIPYRVDGNLYPNYVPLLAEEMDPGLSLRLLGTSETTTTWSAFAPTCSPTCFIPSGTTVILDSNMDVDSLLIQGDLIWDTSIANLELQSGFVVIEGDGTFQLGSQGEEMQYPATIYLKNNGLRHDVLGARVFGGYFSTARNSTVGIGPNIQIHGRVLQRTWTLLTTTTNAGVTEITVADDPAAMGWRIGDRIAIAPTGLPVTSQVGTGYGETFNISAMSPFQITLSAPTTQMHLGDASQTMQGEVINLSRNVLITGDPFDVNNYGLTTILSQGGQMQINYARVEKGGQRGLLGRYPLHFHMVSDICTPSTCIFRGNAVEESTQRGIVCHGTHNSLIEFNVLYNVQGAGLYLEDGNEMQNTFSNNVNICPDGSLNRANCAAPGTDNEQADDIQQSGFWALAVTNNFIENRMVNQYNALFTQTSAFPYGQGFSQGELCTQYFQFGNFSGNVDHSNWRFGFYLDNNFPRQVSRSIATDGKVTDIAEFLAQTGNSSCDEFKPNGSDNGLVGVVQDGLEWCNNFVGQYDLGDIQYLRLRAVTNLIGLYWKTTKNFQDGYSSHVKDSVFGFYPNTGMPGIPAEGVGHILGPGGLGAFIIENSFFFGPVTEGSICANQQCGVGPGTGSLCTPEYTLINVSFSGLDPAAPWIRFGVSSGNQELPIFTTFDDSLGGVVSVASAYQTHLLSILGGVCKTAASIGKSVEFDGGIVCAGKARRLQVWSGDQGSLLLISPGGGTYSMSYQLSTCEGCIGNPESSRTGYGAVVLAGSQYSYQIPTLNWSFLPSIAYGPVTIEYSDLIFGTRFGQPESINLVVNNQECLEAPGVPGVSSQHDRLFIGFNGPKAPNHGACLQRGSQLPPAITLIPSTTLAPSMSTSSPFITPTKSISSSPTTLAPSLACTPIWTDPWASGADIPCCLELITCLKDWNNNGDYFYLCVESEAGCIVTNSPTGATQSPTSFTESPTSATHSPTRTTKSPTVATKSPTGTTKSPTVKPINSARTKRPSQV